MPDKDRQFPTETDIYFANSELGQARDKLRQKNDSATHLALEVYRSYAAGSLARADKQARKLTSLGMEIAREQVKVDGAAGWLAKLQKMRAAKDGERDA